MEIEQNDVFDHRNIILHSLKMRSSERVGWFIRQRKGLTNKYSCRVYRVGGFNENAFINCMCIAVTENLTEKNVWEMVKSVYNGV